MIDHYHYPSVSLNVVLSARLDGAMNVSFAVLAFCSVIEAKKLAITTYSLIITSICFLYSWWVLVCVR
jgi:hypothetical protein